MWYDVVYLLWQLLYDQPQEILLWQCVCSNVQPANFKNLMMIFCIIASKSDHNFGDFSSVLLSSNLLSFWPAHEMKLPSICVGSQLCSQLILQQENRMTPCFKQQEHRCCSYFNLTFCLPDRKQSSHRKTLRHHENLLNSSFRKAWHTCPFLLVANGRLKYGIASWTPFPILDFHVWMKTWH